MRPANRLDEAEKQLQVALEEIDLSDRDEVKLESTIHTVQFLRDRYALDGQEGSHD